MRSCPTCGHPGLMQPHCVMCSWQPEPPPEQSHLLVGDQVVTVRRVQVAGVPIGEPVAWRSCWDWVQRHKH